MVEFVVFNFCGEVVMETRFNLNSCMLKVDYYNDEVTFYTLGKDGRIADYISVVGKEDLIELRDILIEGWDENNL